MSYSFNVAQFLVELARNPHYRNQIAHIAHLPEQAPRFGELSKPLPNTLNDALKNLGISELYTHQAQAVETARDGKSFVVVTATASGKQQQSNLANWATVAQNGGIDQVDTVWYPNAQDMTARLLGGPEFHSSEFMPIIDFPASRLGELGNFPVAGLRSSEDTNPARYADETVNIRLKYFTLWPFPSIR